MFIILEIKVYLVKSHKKVLNPEIFDKIMIAFIFLLIHQKVKINRFRLIQIGRQELESHLKLLF